MDLVGETRVAASIRTPDELRHPVAGVVRTPDDLGHRVAGAVWTPNEAGHQMAGPLWTETRRGHRVAASVRAPPPRPARAPDSSATACCRMISPAIFGDQERLPR